MSLPDVRSCLQSIEEGDFDNFNVNAFTKAFRNDAVKYGDHLQFRLQKFCRQNKKTKDEMTVIKLSKLCFSEQSVAGFKNMDRFLGSLYHISSYHLKRNNYPVALEIGHSIDFKTIEIENCALNNLGIRDVLYSLHFIFLTAAQGIGNQLVDESSEEVQLSNDLAQMSIKFLQFIKFQQLEMGKKLFRNFRLYFNTLKFYDRENVLALYREIEDVLHNIMPNYRNHNFLHFYIITMDQVQNERNMSLEELNKTFQRHLRLISVFMSDSKTLRHWEALLSGDAVNEKYLKNFISGAVKIVGNKQSKLHLLVLTIFFNHVVQLWIKNCTENWSEVFSSEIIKQTYTRILLPIKNFIRNLTESYTVENYQMDVCFMDVYNMNLILVLQMIRSCLKYNVKGSLNLVKISREIFRYIQNSLKESKRLCCVTRNQRCWNGLVVQYTNTVEWLLKQSDSDQAWTFMKECCEELLYEILNSKFELPCERDRVKLLFQRWHYACIKLKDYDEALFVCALFAISFPKEEEDSLSMWIQTKKYLSSHPRQSLTFKDVIDGAKTRIKCICPKWEPIAENMRKLLMLELMAYGSCLGFNVVTPNTASIIWEMLKKMDLELCDKAAALNNVLFAAISSGDANSMKEYKKESEEVVAEILRSRDRHNCRSLLYAGNLKYALFLCRLKSIQDAEDKSNSTKSILEYLKKEEEVKVKFGENVDLNLTCDVMPSTSHFTVSFEESYLTALNETLRLWEEAADAVKVDSLESHEFIAWLHYIKHIALMYYLIGDVHQSFLSWKLYYGVAKICGNWSSILLALSQIIPECTAIGNTKLLKEAEVIAEKLLSESKERDSVILYWLAVGCNHLKNRNRIGCLDYLRKVATFLPQVRSSTRFHICSARYWCLVSQFLLLYPDGSDELLPKHYTELMNVVSEAFDHVNSAVKDGSVENIGSGEYMEILLTMLEVNVWAFHFFGFYSKVTFMRHFLDDLYQIFQKLVLPTRTAFILSLLTEVDVMCEKVEEANTKLMTLKRILGHSYSSSVAEDQTEQKKPDQLEVRRNDEEEEERESPRVSPARFLDIRDAAESNGADRDPSPLRYVLNDVDLAKKLNHVRRCQCYTCRSVIIKLLCMNALLLEARLNQINRALKKSCWYYREGYKNLKKLELYQMSLSEKVSRCGDYFRGIIDFQGNLIRMNSVKFFLNYATFVLYVWKDDKMKEVHKLMEKIDKNMERMSYEGKLLEWKAIELKIVALTVHELKEKERDARKVTEPVRVASQSPNRIPVKTPIPSRKPVKNVAPVKYTTEVAKSPNHFVSKPAGRKIFTDDDDYDDDKNKSPIKGS